MIFNKEVGRKSASWKILYIYTSLTTNKYSQSHGVRRNHKGWEFDSLRTLIRKTRTFRSD